jgi:hypothetical protein
MKPYSSYQYEALPDPETHIRLLVIWPVEDTDELKTSLEVCHIAEIPPFEALSYAWGRDAPTSSLSCESAIIAITPHLYEGIRQLRDVVKCSRVWIDAICINQDDNVEKASQIPLMTNVYSQASRVLVWLGSAADCSDQVLDELPLLLDNFQRAKKLILRTNEAHEEAGLPLLGDPFWVSLASFWSRSWFQRGWIVQEAVLAKDILFICGTKLSTFALFDLFWYEAQRNLFMDEIERKAPKRMESRQGRLTVQNLVWLRELFSRGDLIPASDLAQIGRDLNVSEPLDRIYGLIGLMPDAIRGAVVVDYSVTSRQEYWKLYISVGKMLLQQESLDFLRYSESNERPPELPSWVPNWNASQPAVRLQMHFSAGITTKDSLSKPKLFPNSDNIEVAGFELGVVVATLPLEHKDLIETDTIGGPKGHAAQNLQVIDDTLSLYKVPHNENKGFLEKLARTLLTDSYQDPETSIWQSYPEDVQDHFIQYRRYLSIWAHGETDAHADLDFVSVAERASKYSRHIPGTWQGRSLCVTDNGRVGLVSQSCQPGDCLCIFLGANMPFALRKVEGQESFILVGDAYVDGVMYGEALQDRDKFADRSFIIE